jgi:hypothetical protein
MTDIEKFHAELTGACPPSFDPIPVADDWPSFLARIIYSRNEQVRASVLRRRGHGGIDSSSGPRTHEVAGFVFGTYKSPLVASRSCAASRSRGSIVSISTEDGRFWAGTIIAVDTRR